MSEIYQIGPQASKVTDGHAAQWTLRTRGTLKHPAHHGEGKMVMVCVAMRRVFPQGFWQPGTGIEVEAPAAEVLDQVPNTGTYSKTILDLGHSF